MGIIIFNVLKHKNKTIKTIQLKCFRRKYLFGVLNISFKTRYCNCNMYVLLNFIVF